MKTILLYLAVGISCTAFAQKYDTLTPMPPAPGTVVVPVSGERVFTVVEQMPVFPGGDSAMRAFLIAGMRYPKQEIKKKHEGTVVVSFAVEKDGSVSAVRVKQGVSAELDSEAIRLVNLMGGFEPGRREGVPMRMELAISITFHLPGHEPKIYENIVDSVVSEELGETVYKAAERMPVPQGGEKGLQEWIKDHTIYPHNAAMSNIDGKVIVGFIVNEEGSLSDFHIKKGVSKELNDEAIRVVKSVPPMTAASIGGKPVKVITWIPVEFDLGFQKHSDGPPHGTAPVWGPGTNYVPTPQGY